MTETIPQVLAEQQALDREQRRTERQAAVAIGATDLAIAGKQTAFLPANLGEAMQFAGFMADSNFVPPWMRGRPGDCMAIVMQAMRWGMDPYAVANKSYFVKDGAPPAFESQLINAVVNSSGALIGRLRVEFVGEGPHLRCTVRGVLKADPTDEKVVTQSISRVTTKNSPLWNAHPEQQLEYYTTRAWARAKCPEVLLGVYTPEEVEQFNVRLPQEQRTPVGPSPDAPPRPTRDTVSRGAQTRDIPEAEVHQPATELPQTPTEWETWRTGLLAKIDAAQDSDTLNALVRDELVRINASMFTDDVMSTVTARITDLLIGGDDA
jgi:hypothetical protein